MPENRDGLSTNHVEPRRRAPSQDHSLSPSHPQSNTRAGPSAKPLTLEKVVVPVYNNSVDKQLSDTQSGTEPMHPSKQLPPKTRNTSGHHPLSDARAGHSVAEKGGPPAAQNASTANPLIQMQTERVVNPLLQGEEMFSTSHSILTNSSSDIGQSQDTRALNEANKLPVPTPRNIRPKPAVIPPPQQDTSTPTHAPKTSVLRRKPSNQ